MMSKQRGNWIFGTKLMNPNLATVRAYYDAINRKQVDVAADQLAEHVEIHSPLGSKYGKGDVVEALKGFATLVQQITITTECPVDDHIMLAYDMLFPEPIGMLRAAGLTKLQQQKIVYIELFYDAQKILSKKELIYSSAAPTT